MSKDRAVSCKKYTVERPLLARSGLTLGAWGLRGLTPSGPGLNMPNLREWALESR